jgi:alpha-D-ribose 1-methylphosphonate 5-triphosphate synthase subunit PhnL
MAGLFPERHLMVSKAEQKNVGYLVSQFSRVVPNINKAKVDLNWAPQTSIEKGFRRTVLSFEIPKLNS